MSDELTRLRDALAQGYTIERELGRREWYNRSGYSRRAMVENAIYRYKMIIGRGMRSRTLSLAPPRLRNEPLNSISCVWESSCVATRPR